MTPDEQFDLRQSILKEVKENFHNQPSPTTIIFMEKVETKIDKMSEKIEGMNLNLQTHIVSQKELLRNNQLEHKAFLESLEKLHEWQSTADKQYSDMWKNQYQERQSIKKKVYDIAWKVVLFVLLIMANLDNVPNPF